MSSAQSGPRTVLRRNRRILFRSRDCSYLSDPPCAQVRHPYTTVEKMMVLFGNLHFQRNTIRLQNTCSRRRLLCTASTDIYSQLVEQALVNALDVVLERQQMLRLCLQLNAQSAGTRLLQFWDSKIRNTENTTIR